ncbi:MAG: hypothetical protein AAF322_21225 [Pseudomonadota bacterium]
MLRSEHPLLGRLRARRGGDAKTLWSEMEAIFDAYLDPKNAEVVAASRTLAALTGDAAKAADDDVASAWAEGLDALAEELARGQTAAADRAEWRVALVLAAGGAGAGRGAPPGRPASASSPAPARRSTPPSRRWRRGRARLN